MACYEHVIISRPNISTTQVSEMITQLSKRVKTLGGTVVKTEYWGLRTLAHRIKKNRKAHYSFLQIEGAPGLLHEIERQHRINEDILRYLSVRVEEFDTEPSAVMAPREDYRKQES